MLDHKVPTDLRRVLKASSSVESIWNSLTPLARRDFITWIDSAKQDKTRKSRIERVPSMLKSGKRRPCCYAIVPHSLYKALDAFPKAKNEWKGLTPDERRDCVAWIDSATESETKTKRIEKVCVLLLAHKRHP